MKKYIKPLIDEGFLEMDIPDKPNSRLQRYYTTEKGKALLAESAS
jgi:ATP-dependent DNA helicase RecG